MGSYFIDDVFPRWKYRQQRLESFIRTQRPIRKIALGSRVVWFDHQRKTFYTGCVWSLGPKQGSRWIIPDHPDAKNPEPGYSGCVWKYVSGLTPLGEFLWHNRTAHPDYAEPLVKTGKCVPQRKKRVRNKSASKPTERVEVEDTPTQNI